MTKTTATDSRFEVRNKFEKKLQYKKAAFLRMILFVVNVKSDSHLRKMLALFSSWKPGNQFVIFKPLSYIFRRSNRI